MTTAQLRRVAMIVNGGTPAPEPSNWDGDLPWATPEDLSRSGMNLNQTRRTISQQGLDLSSATLVPPESLIVSTRAPIGYVAIAQMPTAFNQGCRAVVPGSGMLPRYLYYQLTAMAHELEAEGRGSTFRELSAAQLAAMRVQVPPARRQYQVADFLDQETSRIDALASAKKRLIDLLAEKRDALITHAITKGLDPSVPMKDSGVTWIGAIPSHWDIRALRSFRAEIQTGPFGSQLHAKDYVADGTPIINATHIRDGKLIPDPAVTADPNTVDRLAIHLMQHGDLVFGRRGEAARVALVSDREAGWLCGTGAIRLRIRDSSIDPRFLAFVVNSSPTTAYFEALGTRATMLNLNEAILRGLPVPTPPITEQNDIAHQLERSQTVELTLRSALERQLALLAEYRQALITAAVTGLLDEVTMRGARPVDESLAMEVPV